MKLIYESVDLIGFLSDIEYEISDMLAISAGYIFIQSVFVNSTTRFNPATQGTRNYFLTLAIAPLIDIA